jgi:8-oxo-dGTP pyrophosphatase MutT (NUDIX family)
MIRKLPLALKESIASGLPGKEAQMLMAPTFRGVKSVHYKTDRIPKLAGVMVLMYPDDVSASFVLMRRNEYPGVHSGQISFPGGKKEEHDYDLVQTALRETEEEIGIDRRKVELLGSLTEVYIPPSNFHVLPSMGWMADRPQFIPDKSEVQELLEINIHHFLDDSIITNTQVNVRGVDREVPAFVLDESIVWGATAIMLSEFRVLLKTTLKKLSI